MSKMATLCIFNPEHDLALANGSRFFNAPQSAAKFSSDCCELLLHVFGNDNAAKGDNELVIGCRDSIAKGLIADAAITTVKPWGWNSAIVETLRKAGIDESLMPSAEQLNFIREISHRGFAIDVLAAVKDKLQLDIALPQLHAGAEDVERFLTESGTLVCKMPWSGSGKGIRFINGDMTYNDRRWVENVVAKQGSVLSDRCYSVVQDFAMEFYVADEVTFMGYSLFDTNGTSYKSSRLMHDEVIERQLYRWGITKDFLLNVRDVLIAHLSETLVTKYKGYFGVDMFVYEDCGCYKVNPVVEINFRMTMGLVAAVLRAKLLATDLQSMFMHYEAESEKLKAVHDYYRQKYPLRWSDNGKILSGYFPLTAINEDTNYHLYIL